MYLTYDEYVEMGGTLDEAVFSDYEFEAESIINWYTFNRLQKETEFSPTVKKLVYRLIKLCDNNAKAHILSTGDGVGGSFSGVLASQSNDGYSATYSSLTASDMISESQAEAKRLINLYLRSEVNSLGRSLLYRGIYYGE